jgi:hypothetical protein
VVKAYCVPASSVNMQGYATRFTFIAGAIFRRVRQCDNFFGAEEWGELIANRISASGDYGEAAVEEASTNITALGIPSAGPSSGLAVNGRHGQWRIRI